MINHAPAKNNQPAASTFVIHSRPGGPVSAINTPTPLEPIATPPSTKQITVPSAATAPTVESLSVLIAPTLAPQYPGCYVYGFPRFSGDYLSPRRSSGKCCAGRCGRAIHSSPVFVDPAGWRLRAGSRSWRGRPRHGGADAVHDYTDSGRPGADRGAVCDCVAGRVAFRIAIPRCHSLGGLVVRNRLAYPPRSSPLSRLSLVLAEAAAAGGAANVTGLSLMCDVLLGVLFVLWTAWWISAGPSQRRSQLGTTVGPRLTCELGDGTCSPPTEKIVRRMPVPQRRPPNGVGNLRSLQ